MTWADTQFGFLPPISPDPNHQDLYACGDCTPQPEGPFGDPTCEDGIDKDCDGAVDSADPDCQDGTMACSDYTSKGECNNDPFCDQPVVYSDITKKNECNNTPGCMSDQSTRTYVDVP